MRTWWSFIGALATYGLVAAGLVGVVVLFMRWKTPKDGPELLTRFPLRRFVPVILFLWLKSTFGWYDPRWVSCGILASLSVLLVELQLEYVFVPLGLCRTSYVLMRLAKHPAALVSGQVGPAFWAARALLRRPSEAGAEFVERKLSTCCDLSVLGSAALALVLLSRGQKERAHGIFSGLAATPFGALGRDAARVVNEACVLEAAACGDWRKASDLSDFRPRSRLTRLFNGIAERLEFDVTAPSVVDLWLRWLLAPHRLATWPLVRRASQSFVPEPVAPIAPDLTAHAALARRLPYGVRAEDVLAAAASLDALRPSEKFREDIELRAASFAGTQASQVELAVFIQAESDLSDALLEARLPAAWLPPGPTGDAVRARVREERLARVQRLAKELARRTAANEDLDEPGEWQAWGDLSLASDEFLRDAVNAVDYEVLFRILHRPLWNHGYRQCFELGRRLLGNTVFKRQLELSEMARSFETRATIVQNLAASELEALPHKSDLEGEAHHDARALQRARNRVAAVFVSTVCGAAAVCMMARYLPSVVVPGLAGTIPFALVFRLISRRLVEIVETEDGIVLQTHSHRHMARAKDVTLRAGPSGVLWIDLARAPQWLSRRLWTMQSSPESARAAVARFSRPRLSL